MMKWIRSLICCFLLLPLFLAAQTAEQQLDRGIGRYYQQDFTESIEILLPLLAQKNKPALVGKACCFLAECYFEVQEIGAAQAYFVKADSVLQTHQLATDTLGHYFRVLQGIAVTTPTSTFEEKVKLYQPLIDWVTQHPHPSVRAQGAALYAQGVVHRYAGELHKALPYFQQSLAVQASLGADPFLLAEYSTMAVSMADLQDYYLAISYQQRALELISPDRPSIYFRQLLNLGGFYLDNRDLTEARNTIRAAGTFGRAHIPLSDPYWPQYYDLQREYCNIKVELDSFAYYQRESEAYYRSQPDMKSTKGYHSHLNLGAALAIRQKKYDQADSILNLVKECFPFAEADYENYLYSYFLGSKVDVAQNNFEKGIKAIHTLLFINSSLVYDGVNKPLHQLFTSEELESTPLVLEYLKDLSSYYNYWDADCQDVRWLQLSNQTIALADSIMVSVKQRNSQPGLRRQLDEISQELRKVEMENLYQLYKREGSPAYFLRAIHASEAVKHLSISERLHDNLLTEDFGLPKAIIELDRTYDHRQATLLAILSQGKLTSTAAQLLTDSLLTVQRQQAELRQRVNKDYPSFAALRFDPPDITVADIQRNLLVPNEVLLHFLEQDKVLYVIGLHEGGTLFEKLTLTDELAVLAPALIQKMESQEESIYPVLHQLYEDIITPIQTFIADRNLVIVPDGRLWYLPFHAFLAESTTTSDTKTYLIQEREIRHLFSLRVGLLQYARGYSATSPRYEILSMSPFISEGIDGFQRLEGSKQIASLLHQLLNGRGQFFANQTATLANFDTYAPQVRLLHLYTHAIIDEGDADSSFLMLHPMQGSPSAGQLRASDIYNAQIEAELAVLAACSTGGGKLYKGQGVANLARAFAHAGCDNLVVNLWEAKVKPINDLLSVYYPALLRQGKTSTSALARAQRQYLNDNFMGTHPGLWAMTIYIGDNRRFEPKRHPLLRWWPYLTALLVLFLSTKYLRKKDA